MREDSASSARIKWILCTHTHLDHSPAAAAIKAATGAQVLGRPAPAGQDATFKPDVVVENGQRIELEGGVTLRAIHTPGHASNHVCYLLEETKMLFTGDHVMQGSTVVITPPDGDMRAYLQSLERLLDEDLAIIAPGHGYLIGAPHKEVRRLIAHRLNRERKVVAALVRLEHPSLDEMLPLVYDDVPERIHRVAARSLTAHLDKLVAEGAVRLEESRYTLVRSASWRRAMSSESEKTMKLVTNLDRKAIEGKLAEVRSTAQAANLKELADMFNGVEGMPRAQIEQKVKNALKWLGDKPQHNRSPRSSSWSA